MGYGSGRAADAWGIWGDFLGPAEFRARTVSPRGLALRATWPSQLVLCDKALRNIDIELQPFYSAYGICGSGTPKGPVGANSPVLCDMRCNCRETLHGWGSKGRGRWGASPPTVRRLAWGDSWAGAVSQHASLWALWAAWASSLHGGLGGLELPCYTAAQGSGVEAVRPFLTQPWKSPSTLRPLSRLKKSQAFPDARGQDTDPTFQWEEHQGICSRT